VKRLPHEAAVHGEQHHAGIAVDLLLSKREQQRLAAEGFLRPEDVYATHVHIAALADRWQQ